MSEKRRFHQLTAQEIHAIKSSANKYFYDITKPADLESGDFVTLCYTLAACDFMSRLSGVTVDITYRSERTFQEPIE